MTLKIRKRNSKKNKWWPKELITNIKTNKNGNWLEVRHKKIYEWEKNIEDQKWNLNLKNELKPKIRIRIKKNEIIKSVFLKANW